jgi:cell division FtsZ-interacting protein ZapD
MAVQPQGLYSLLIMPIHFIWRHLKTRWRDQRVEALLRGLGPKDVALDLGARERPPTSQGSPPTG